MNSESVQISNTPKLSARDMMNSRELINQKIPPELMADIFLHSLPIRTREDVSPSHNVEGYSSPVWLAQVCSNWRSIALATPQLWTSILILAPDEMQLQSRRDHILDMTKTWLHRSGSSLPLSVYINFGISKDADSALLILAAIVAQSHRWRYASLSMSQTFYLKPIFSPTMTFPVLEALDIHASSSVLPLAPVQQPLTSFNATPRLVDVFVRTTNLARFGILNLPWSQLTTLRLLSIYDVNIILQFLQKTPNLKELVVESQAASGQDYVELPHVNSPAVKSAKLRVLSFASSKSIVMNLLRSTTLSALEELTLEFTPRPRLAAISRVATADMGSLETVTAFLARSNPPLRKITLSDSGNQLNALEIYSFLDSVPTLEELSVTLRRASNNAPSSYVTRLAARRTTGDSILSGLTFTSEKIDDIAVNLRHLLINTQGENISADTLLDMLLSRWDDGNQARGYTKIISVEIHCLHVVGYAECQLQLQELKEQGLNLRVITPQSRLL